MNIIDVLFGGAGHPSPASSPSVPDNPIAALLAKLPGGAGSPRADVPPQGAVPQPPDPPDVLGRPFPSRPYQTSAGGLLTAVTGSVPAARGIGAALAGGFGAMDGSMPLGAFGKSMGGALKGSNDFDEAEFGRGVKAVDMVRRSNEADATLGLIDAKTDLARRRASALTDGGSDDDETGVPKTLAEMPRSRRVIAAEGLIARSLARTEKTIDGLATNFRMTDEQRKQETERLRALHGEYEKRIRRELGVGETPAGAAPAAPAPAAPAAPKAADTFNDRFRGELGMMGNGTRETPYAPTTADDYSAIVPGSFYRHPDGTVRIKR